MPEEVFDKQAFLISYFDDIANIVQNNKYDYVYVLNTREVSLPTTISALTDRLDIGKFVELKTYQYNALIPRVRLYRMEYAYDKSIKSEKQFIFEKDVKYDTSNITTGILRNNCGIKSINWKLAGSNPVTAEKQIEVEIQFYFDSINAFSGGDYASMVSAWNKASTELYAFDLKNFEFCDTETTTKNYWSLLFHPKNKKETYDTFNFRIKAIVGWEDISENIRTQLKLSDAEEEIKKLNYSFFLNLIKHQFTLNEDGSFLVTANYIASFESTTLNYQFDILGDLKSQLQNLKNKTINTIFGNSLEEVESTQDAGIFGTELQRTLTEIGVSKLLGEQINSLSVSQLAGLSKFANSLTNEQTLQSLINCGQLPTEIANILQTQSRINKITLQKQAENFNKINDIANNYLERATQLEIRKFYSSFIDQLISVDDQSNSRFYAIKVSKNNKDAWSTWYSGAPQPKPTFNSLDGITDQSAINSEIQKTKEELKNSISADESQIIDSSNDSESDEEIKIVFTNFGSIVDTAYKVVARHIREKDSSSPLLNELLKLKTILGNISDENQIFKYNTTPSAADSVPANIKNIAFAPIEINLLKKFLIDNIIKPKKTTYSLSAFLKDILSTLVVASVNSFGDKNDEVDKLANISLGSNVITLGDNGENFDPLSNFIIGNNSIIEAGDLISNPTNLKSFYINELNIGKHKNYYTYLLMYDKTLKDYKPQNDRSLDQEQGVYHYTYGQDYGLVKAINFTRIDQPYLKEAKAVGTKTLYLGQFRDIYNADVTMIGNNIYYPGMMLYLKPSVETSIKVSGDFPNFSQITGIGGYYFVTQVESSITEDSYETKLKTIWHSDGYERQNSLDEKEKCKALLQEAGLLNADTADPSIQILQSLNDASFAVATEELGLLETAYNFYFGNE